MINIKEFDPDFDDEDEENEEIYRQLLKKGENLPPCPSNTLPATSFSQRCTLCSRIEAENMLKTHSDIRPGNFILRPSSHTNHPYSLTVLSNENTVHHFQIGKISNKYVIGPFETVDLTKTKTFSSISTLLENYVTFPLKFQEDNNKEHSIYLQLYSIVEITRL